MDHIPDVTKMVPLTLEQLREMDGHPAYCRKMIAGELFLLTARGHGMECRFFRGRKFGVNFEYDIESRGVEVYAYQASHIDQDGGKDRNVPTNSTYIDREAFGCEFCNVENHCANCLYDNLPWKMEPCRSCEDHSKWETAHRFCPNCGKPQTEDAWAELEKRLRGLWCEVRKLQE